MTEDRIYPDARVHYEKPEGTPGACGECYTTGLLVSNTPDAMVLAHTQAPGIGATYGAIVIQWGWVIDAYTLGDEEEIVRPTTTEEILAKAVADESH